MEEDKDRSLSIRRNLEILSQSVSVTPKILQDIEVINLKEGGRHKELGNGSLYDKLQRKMT